MPRLQALLACLALHPGVPQPRQRLAFLLWPDSTDSQARTNLRTLIHRLRAALTEVDTVLSMDAHHLWWRSDARAEVDVVAFEAALRLAEDAAGHNDDERAQEALTSAVALYRGDLLPECFDEWILPERERLRALALNAVGRLTTLLGQRRAYPQAVACAQRWLALDPLDEAAALALVRLQSAVGERSASLRTYQQIAARLRAAFDVEPGPELQATYNQLREAPPETARTSAPLIGRFTAWAAAQSVLQAASREPPWLLAVMGEAGIGKTRLAEEVLQWARRQGWLTAQARCYAAEGSLAYGPIADWLRTPALRLTRRSLDALWLVEVARVLPELLTAHPDLSPPAPLTEGWQRRRLFEALARATLATGRPLVLLLDDLQWADQDTLEWLHFLLRFDPAAHLLIVITVRAEEVAADHSLHQLLDAAQREQRLTQLALSPLSFAETATLGAQLAGHALAVGHPEQLFAETEGNPLFIIELVRAGLAGGSETGLAPSPASDATRLPARIQRTIERRFASLSTAARELLNLAAVLGRAFSLAVLLAATDNPSAAFDALDELCQRRVFREQGGDDYDFSHDKLRAVAYAGLGQARRRLLHRRAAEALTAVAPAGLDVVSGQVAAHYEVAGLPRLAINHYRRAAASAAGVFANHEAIALLRRALDLAGDAPASERAALACELGAVLQRIGAFDEAREVYERALRTLARADRVARARLLCEVGSASDAQKRPGIALAALDAAEQALGDAPGTADPAWWLVWVDVQLLRLMSHYWLGAWVQMEALVERVQPTIERCGTPLQWSQLLMALNNISCFRDRFRISDRMLERQREILRIGQAHGDLESLTGAHFETGFMLLWYGDHHGAEQHLNIALELAERSGNLSNQARTLAYLAVAARFAGRVAEVMLQCERLAQDAHTIDDHTYMGVSEAGIAWAELRSGRPVAARARAEAALEHWQQSAFPFRWMAAWPLLGVALAEGRSDAALEIARALLEPAQQRLPESLELPLQETILLAEAGNHDAASILLEQVCEPARARGYL